MSKLCLYISVHQQYQLLKWHVGGHPLYEDIKADKAYTDHMADEHYLPANRNLRSLIDQYKGKLKVAFTISGTTLELLENYRWDVIGSFNELLQFDKVEMLGETYYHSYSSFFSPREFERQVNMHSNIMFDAFCVRPTVFKNTDLIYDHHIAETLTNYGFQAKLTNDPTQLAGIDSNSFCPINTVKLLPLKKYASTRTIQDIQGEETMNLSMDLASLSKKESLQFQFIQKLMSRVISKEISKPHIENKFANDNLKMSEANSDPIASLSIPDNYRPTFSSRIKNTLERLYALEDQVMQCRDKRLKSAWGRMQDATYFDNPFQTGLAIRNAEPGMRNYSAILSEMENQLQSKTIHQNTGQRSSPVFATF